MDGWRSDMDGWPFGVKRVSQEEAHGDAWFARIRARHEELGADCPCGNGVAEEES